MRSYTDVCLQEASRTVSTAPVPRASSIVSESQHSDSVFRDEVDDVKGKPLDRSAPYRQISCHYFAKRPLSRCFTSCHGSPADSPVRTRRARRSISAAHAFSTAVGSSSGSSSRLASSSAATSARSLCGSLRASSKRASRVIDRFYHREAKGWHSTTRLERSPSRGGRQGLRRLIVRFLYAMASSVTHTSIETGDAASRYSRWVSISLAAAASGSSGASSRNLSSSTLALAVSSRLR